MKAMKYHDYIWDWGGTLLDNYETSTASFLETLVPYAITEDHDRVYQALREKYQISSGIVIGDWPIDIEAGQLLDSKPTCLLVS